MKTTFLFFVFLLSLQSFNAQNSCSLVYSPVPPNGGVATQLLNNPADANQLLLTEMKSGWPNESYSVMTYDGITGVNPSPILVCDSMSTILMPAHGGLLFGGFTPLKGNEPVFFDGQQSIIFDINPGQSDSDPEIFNSDGRTFFTAFDGSNRQLYELLSNGNYQQISSETNADVSYPVGHVALDVFFVTVVNDSIYKLKKSTAIGSTFTVSTLRNKTGIFYRWLLLGDVNSKTLFNETDISIFAGEQDMVRVFSIDNNTGTQHVLFEDSTVVGNLSPWKGVKYNAELYLCIGTTLYKTTDGLTYTTDQVLIDEGFAQHFFFNGNLYFITSTISDQNNLYRFASGNSNLIYTGRHLHLSITNDSEVYLTDLQYSNLSKYLRLNGNDQITLWNIKDSSNHGPVMNAAVMLDNKPFFLWSGIGLNANFYPNMDIYSIDSFLGIDEKSADYEILLYPNPIQVGDELTVVVNQTSEYQLHDVTGRILDKGTFTSGQNKLKTLTLNSGSYYLKLEDSIVKIVVR